jgi:hypothetical protein
MLTKSLDDQSWSEYDLVNHFSGVVDVVYPYYYSDGLSYSSIENLYEENKVTVNDRSLKMVNQLCELTD